MEQVSKLWSLQSPKHQPQNYFTVNQVNSLQYYITAERQQLLFKTNCSECIPEMLKWSSLKKLLSFCQQRIYVTSFHVHFEKRHCNPLALRSIYNLFSFCKNLSHVVNNFNRATSTQRQHPADLITQAVRDGEFSSPFVLKELFEGAVSTMYKNKGRVQLHLFHRVKECTRGANGMSNLGWTPL